jgi:ubiquinone/menaquinone biosynthesis C-methylase UbiE
VISDSYDERIAHHYAAYRPPLHELILGRVFEPHERFGNGLDVGCGVGYSTVALRRWCDSVRGVDPNEAMLSRAIEADGVSYLLASGQALPLPDCSVDVVTFAGSLFYARSPELLSELRRVCRPRASLVPYDFEVLIEEVMVRLGCPAKTSTYDHSLTFAGDFPEVMARQEKLGLDLTASQLAHILLSSQRRYRLLADLLKVRPETPSTKSQLRADIQDEASPSGPLAQSMAGSRPKRAFSAELLQGELFHALVARLDSEGDRRPVGARLFYSRFEMAAG